MDHTITIAVSEPIAEYIDERVRSGGYDSADEYFRDLVRKDRHEQELSRLRSLIEEGLASGPATEDTEEDRKELRRIARGEL